jgi:hypothetical protein
VCGGVLGRVGVLVTLCGGVLGGALGEEALVFGAMRGLTIGDGVGKA